MSAPEVRPDVCPEVRSETAGRERAGGKSGPEVQSGSPERRRLPAVWWWALLVACCGAVATAHGLYSVVVRAGVMPGLAWLYVPITDGLALVAYACTGRLAGASRAYSWVVVVLSAGLSGLAQAVALSGLDDVDWKLKFGIGYWPAVAVAIAAHLLWLVADEPSVSRVGEPAAEPPPRAHEPVSEPPAAGLTEPSPEPMREPEDRAHDEPSRPAVVSPFRVPRRAAPRAQDDGLLNCDCGSTKCAGRVSKATRTRHRAQQRELAERSV